MAKLVLNEKYRPKKLEDYIFANDLTRSVVSKWIEEKNIPHIFMHGHQGTGKTSLAYLLKNELGIDDSDFLLIDSSSDGNIATLRNDVANFMDTIPMGEANLKIVLFDEIDGMSIAAQKALRGFTQHPSTQYVRFIMTCNNPNAVIPAIHSRAQEIQFKSLDKDSMLERLAEILVTEEIETDLDNMEAYVDRFYPDFRKLLESVDQFTIDGKLTPADEIDVSASEDFELVVLEIFEENKYDNVDIREALSMVMSDADWDNLYKFLYENMHEMGKFADKDMWARGIVVVADHMYKHSQVAVPELNATAMFVRLGLL